MNDDTTTGYVPPTDRRLMRLSRAELQELLYDDDLKRAEAAMREIDRRRLNRERKREARDAETQANVDEDEAA
jgi:hypothetical protein